MEQEHCEDCSSRDWFLQSELMQMAANVATSFPDDYYDRLLQNIKQALMEALMFLTASYDQGEIEFKTEEAAKAFVLLAVLTLEHCHDNGFRSGLSTIPEPSETVH